MCVLLFRLQPRPASRTHRSERHSDGPRVRSERFEPVQVSLRRIRRGGRNVEQHLPTWLFHPDERVPLGALRHIERFDQASHPRIGSALLERGLAEGATWNPILDVVLATRGMNWCPSYAQHKRIDERLAVLRSWAVHVATAADLVQLLRFRAPHLSALVAHSASRIDADVVTALAKREPAHLWLLVRRTDLPKHVAHAACRAVGIEPDAVAALCEPPAAIMPDSAIGS